MARINAWSSPRNISTAFMYSFAQRSDMTVVDEPLYAHYLSKTDSAATHPGTQEVLLSQENDGTKVIEHMLHGHYPTSQVMFKQMTHHLIHLDWAFMLETENILLVRNPREIIASYVKVVPNPSMQDVGVEQQYALHQFLKKNDRLAAVVDARQLLLDPPSVLAQLCERLHLPFDPCMLHWSAGPRAEDGVWAKYWYAAVHRSTGFQPFAEQETALPPALEELAARCRPFYEALLEEAIRA